MSGRGRRNPMSGFWCGQSSGRMSTPEDPQERFDGIRVFAMRCCLAFLIRVADDVSRCKSGLYATSFDCEICVARDCFVVIVAQKTEDACLEAERVTPVTLISLLGYVIHYERSYQAYSAGRGVDLAGGAPRGG
ncbi:hypothetical protein F511_23579 [Dorcoceras hygrometricum]|uniref:Uncharacterized protein n=1 Tax=Dorcoceras hygrometricum TaxID=472368 RepID=A0A2Z7DJ63_9LAMI|nr:hypothetical protein F511_23579 [Dorcoceras hygrometricum]